MSLYRELAEHAQAEYEAGLAQVLVAQADDLQQLDRLDEALAALSEAIEMHGIGSGGRPSEDRASALAEQSRLMSLLGRTDDAVDAAAGAVRVYRALVAVRPDAYHALLTETLSARARVLAGAGRVSEALVDLDEAIALPRRLSREQPRAFWALTGAMPQKSDLLEQAGDADAAQAVSYEAGRLPMPAGMVVVVPGATETEA